MTMSEETKQCTTCKKTKPLSEFRSPYRRKPTCTCRACREARLAYRRRQQREVRPAVVREARRRSGGRLASDDEFLGLPPATLTVVPARPRPCDAGQRWLAVR
jgi:hypothetical protein